MSIRSAVIPAAGLGTRLRPATFWIPKEMFPILDTPAIAFALDEACAAGANRVIVVVSPQKQMLVDFCLAWAKEKRAREGVGLQIQFVEQAHPLGLGHAVLCARRALEGQPFFVLLPDELFCGGKPACAELLTGAPSTWTALLGTQKVPQSEVHQYGIVRLAEGDGERVADVIEKPDAERAPSNLAIVGRYAFQPVIFEALEQTAPDRRGEVQLTDAIRMLCPEGIYARWLSADRFDIGNGLGLVRAAQDLARRRAEATGNPAPAPC